MIYLTGFVGDKLYEETPVKPDELVKIFSLPLDVDSKKPRVVFRVTPRYVKKDRLNGGEKFPAGTKLLTTINGEYQGNYVTIQYSERKITKGSGNNVQITHQPRYLNFSGRANAFAATRREPKDLEKTVFMMLHTKCQQSPLRGPGSHDKRIMLDDSVSTAANKVANVKAFMDAYNQILGADPSYLRTKLAGMKTMNVDTLEDVEVQATLVAMMEQNMEDFLNRWNATTSTFDGVISRAIYLNIIEQYTIGGGIQAWRFTKQVSQKYLSSDVPIDICQIPVNQKPTDAIKNWALAAGSNFAQIKNIIDAMDQAATVERVIAPIMANDASKKASEMTTEEKVEYGFAKDLIMVVEEKGQWNAYFMKAGQKDDFLTAVSDYAHRVKDLVEWFDTEGQSQSSTLSRKITGSQIKK